MKYLMIFYYYIIDKKIFCEKRVFYKKIGKMMSNIGYRSPFLPEWHSHKEQVRLCLYTPHLFSPRTTRPRAVNVGTLNSKSAEVNGTKPKSLRISRVKAS